MGVDFMSQEFLRQYKVAVDEAGRLGMKMCLYDEFWLPRPKVQAVAYYRDSAQDRLENSIPIQHDQFGQWVDKARVTRSGHIHLSIFAREQPTRSHHHSDDDSPGLHTQWSRHEACGRSRSDTPT